MTNEGRRGETPTCRAYVPTPHIFQKLMLLDNEKRATSGHFPFPHRCLDSTVFKRGISLEKSASDGTHFNDGSAAPIPLTMFPSHVEGKLSALDRLSSLLCFFSCRSCANEGVEFEDGLIEESIGEF